MKNLNINGVCNYYKDAASDPFGEGTCIGDECFHYCRTHFEDFCTAADDGIKHNDMFPKEDCDAERT